MMNERPVIAGSKALFVTCFVALMATSFAFLIRAFTIGDWAADFGLDPVQQGELSGAGIWPFAISIILFSLVIDKIGYGKAMAFAFVCHVASVGVTLWAPYMLVDSASADADAVAAGQRAGYWVLYAGMFLAGIAAGTVEAVINPVIATVYAQNKTKWLSILHAAWPGGFVLAGLVAMAMKPTGLLGEMVEGGMGWQWKVGLLLVPTLIYGAMLLRCRFPVNERVTAGVSYREMLSEVGGLGAFFAAGLVFWEIERVVSHFYELPTLPEVAGLPIPLALIPSAVVGLVFLLYTFSLGRPLFL
ncbi:MAG: MFS transporter, partial [Algisphaera sp.]